MPVKLVASMSAARYVLQKYTKSWGWMPPMPHFLFGMRNILNGDGVVDVVRMALLIIYKVCVVGGWGGRLTTERCAESNGCAFLSGFYSQTELDMESYRCYVSKPITTFSLSQMNSVELVRTLSWRENALFEEREKNVFVKPNEQYRACPNIVMARKRTFRGTRKEQISKTHYV